MATRNFDADAYLETWRQAWKDQKVDRLMEAVAEDVVLVDPLSGEEVRGKDAYRDTFQSYLSAFSLDALDVEETVVGERSFAYLLRWKGRHTGPLEIEPGNRLSPTGRAIEVTLANFFVLDDEGRIVRDAPVMDTAAFLRQLGLMEEATASA